MRMTIIGILLSFRSLGQDALLDVQQKAFFLIQLNADSLYPLICLLILMLALLAYPDAENPAADPDCK